MSQELPPHSNAIEPDAKSQGLYANITKSAGAATKIVSLQAERTKLSTLTLPAAYRALGKDCLQQKRHLDCVVELTSQLRSVLNEISQMADSATGQPAPLSFADKAKAAGKYVVDTARQKQQGMKRDSLTASIGKAIYDNLSDASGPAELVGPIASSIARIAQIDTEIGQQSQVGKGSIVTPKRILITVGIGLAILVIYFAQDEPKEAVAKSSDGSQATPAVKEFVSEDDYTSCANAIVAQLETSSSKTISMLKRWQKDFNMDSLQISGLGRHIIESGKNAGFTGDRVLSAVEKARQLMAQNADGYSDAVAAMRISLAFNSMK